MPCDCHAIQSGFLSPHLSVSAAILELRYLRKGVGGYFLMLRLGLQHQLLFRKR